MKVKQTHYELEVATRHSNITKQETLSQSPKIWVFGIESIRSSTVYPEVINTFFALKIMTLHAMLLSTITSNVVRERIRDLQWK